MHRIQIVGVAAHSKYRHCAQSNHEVILCNRGITISIDFSASGCSNSTVLADEQLESVRRPLQDRGFLYDAVQRLGDLSWVNGNKGSGSFFLL